MNIGSISSIILCPKPISYDLLVRCEPGIRVLMTLPIAISLVARRMIILTPRPSNSRSGLPAGAKDRVYEILNDIHDVNRVCHYLEVGDAYRFEAGVVHNLQADRFIANHGDVDNKHTAFAVFEAIRVT